LFKKGEKMNTTIESPLGKVKETTKNPLDMRIILAVLWIAEVLSSLNGDTYRLSDSVALKSLLENSGSIKATPELLLVMSIIFVFPILMSALTLILKAPVSRWANRIIGILYAVIIFGFWVLGFVLGSVSYEFVWSTAQLVFAVMVVWYAWKWQKPEA
jgi:lipopolysaccharide export LptBFGC system permease protein LptF